MGGEIEGKNSIYLESICRSSKYTWLASTRWKRAARTVAPLKMDGPGLLLWWTIYQSATRQSWLMTTRRIVLDTGVYLLILLRLNTTTHLKYFHLLQSLTHRRGKKTTFRKSTLHYNNNRSRCAKRFYELFYISASMARSCLLDSSGSARRVLTQLVSCIRHANFLVKDQ